MTEGVPSVRDLLDLPATLTVEQAAPLYQKSRSAMYRAVRAGDVPAIRVGGSVRVLTWKALEQLGVTISDEGGRESTRLHAVEAVP